MKVRYFSQVELPVRFFFIQEPFLTLTVYLPVKAGSRCCVKLIIPSRHLIVRNYDGANFQVQRWGLNSVTQRTFLLSYHNAFHYID